MKVAMETTLFGRSSMKDALATIGKSGVREIEIGLTHFDACTAGKRELGRLTSLLSENGLRLAALFALPGFDPSKWSKFSYGMSSPDEAERRKGVKMMKSAIRNAVALDCRVLLSELSGDFNHKRASDRAFRKSMSEVVPELEDNDLELCFEAHPGDYIEDSYEAVGLLSSFGSSHVKYNYCIAHTFVLKHTPSEIVRNAKDLIGWAHFADTLDPWRIFFCPTYKPKVTPHLHLTPGLGDIPFDEVMSSLREIGYRAFLSIHPFSHLDRPVEAMNETKRRLDMMLKR
jgi:myo-inositol catabolism protein IolH